MMRRAIVAAAALGILALGLWGLERPRMGLDIRHDRAGETPVTVMRQPGAEGPVVVIAHGFAGSRQLMAAHQLGLARAGYVTVSFDFEGHGRNPVPMSGDVTTTDGTTRLLMAELGRVTDYALRLPGADGRVALLGHSMASDIVARQAIADPRVRAAVGLSMFSRAVTSSEPANLLILNGAWEGMLRREARRVMADLGADEGQTVGDPSDGFARRAVAVPRVEHVGVLYASAGMAEAVAWLNASFGLDRPVAAAALGGPILLALFGTVLLAWPLAGGLPRGPAPWRPPARGFWILALAPALVTPLVLSPFETRILPVLVADYLALHLALYGALVLAVAARMGARRAGPDGSGAWRWRHSDCWPLAACWIVTWPVSCRMRGAGRSWPPSCPRQSWR